MQLGKIGLGRQRRRLRLGTRPQHWLWASTGTKDPAASGYLLLQIDQLQRHIAQAQHFARRQP